MRTYKLFSAALLLLSFSLLASGQIRADEINYSYTSAGNTFTWTLPTNPTPDDFNPGNGFTFNSVSFSESGSGGTTTGTGPMNFFSTSNGGGFDLMLSGGVDLLINAFGDQLYSGPETAPTMLTGHFPTPSGSLTDCAVDPSCPAATLEATPASASVPEPSTLSLLAIALAIGLALTFRRSAKIGLAPSTH